MVKVLKTRLFFRIIVCFLCVAPIYPNDMLSGDERSGHIIVVTLNNGYIARSELLAVTNSAIILGDAELRSGIEIEIDEIDLIKIVRDSKFRRYMGRGFLFGAGTGMTMGFLSGNDRSGFIQLSAGQKAMILGATFGVAGAAVGGVSGAIAGIDESKDIAHVSLDQRKRLLEKLKRKARFTDEIAPAYTIYSASAIIENPEIGEIAGTISGIMITGGTVRRTKPSGEYSRLHLSFTPGYFVTSGVGEIQDIFESVGFRSTEHLPGGWFGGPSTIEYPRSLRNPKLFVKDMKAAYSLDRNFAAGISYSPIGRHEVSGRRVLPNVGTRETVTADTYIVGLYDGHSYFLTASYFPIPDAFLRKQTIKATAGVGIARSQFDFYGSDREYGYDSPSGEDLINHRKFSNSSPALLLSAEVVHFFNRHWSVGLNVDFKYMPVDLGDFTIESYYSYRDDSLFQSGRYRTETVYVDIPARTMNLGGFGFGLSMGFHF
jgi:hypothetical protein